MEHSKPRLILAMLNDALLRADARGCTAVVARLRALKGKRRLTVASGGHPLPLHRYADGTTAPIGRFGTLLGMTENVRHTDVTVELRPNDAVLFYTDGVTELRRGDDFYGDTRLAAALTRTSGTSARDVVEGIEVELRSFQPRFRDDVALACNAARRARRTEQSSHPARAARWTGRSVPFGRRARPRALRRRRVPNRQP